MRWTSSADADTHHLCLLAALVACGKISDVCHTSELMAAVYCISAFPGFYPTENEFSQKHSEILHFDVNFLLNFQTLCSVMSIKLI
jgi:hypothetical protein